MKSDGKHETHPETHPETQSGAGSESEDRGAASVCQSVDYSAEGCIDALCDARMSQAMETLHKVIAEDYAQFMSEQTGIHADYFRS